MRHDPASAAIVIMMRSLKTYGMAQAVEDLIEQGSPAFEAAVPILSQLLKAEVAEREVRSIAYHLKAARFPAYKDLARFDFAASEINEALVRQLHRCEFIDAAHNVVLIGGPGTGKTHVATALGVQAVEHHRRKVRFFSTVELVNTLEQEKAKGAAGKIAESLARRPRHPRRARLPAVQRHRRRPALPPPQQALRAHQRRHHHQPQLQRMGSGLRRRQDDHRAPRSPHPPLPHPRARKRQLPLQGQHRDSA
jgi:Cdc6-like AAA superfamily ATPase